MLPAPSSFASAGNTAWRLLGIGAVVVATWLIARYLMPVLVPVVIAVMLATLLRPLALRLEARGVPPSGAALLAVGVLVAAVAVLASMIVPPFVSRVSALGDNVEAGLREVAFTLGHDVAGMSRSSVNEAVDDLLDNIDDNRGQIAGDVLAGATALAQAAGAVVLVLFLSFFIVRDADRIGRWLVALAPAAQRPVVEAGGAAVWAALGVYIRGVMFVATVDALFIGLTLVVVGVPLALPLIVLTWVAAFFPIVGALVAGAIAVLVTLVGNGAAAAVVVAVAILLVQQLEGNVLYPTIVGPRLKLHPIAVLLAVLIGGTIGGIPGAFLAVPVTTAFAVLLAQHQQRRAEGPSVTVPEDWPAETLRQ